MQKKLHTLSIVCNHQEFDFDENRLYYTYSHMRADEIIGLQLNVCRYVL